jgi:hypothetical protein
LLSFIFFAYISNLILLHGSRRSLRSVKIHDGLGFNTNSRSHNQLEWYWNAFCITKSCGFRSGCWLVAAVSSVGSLEHACYPL